MIAEGPATRHRTSFQAVAAAALVAAGCGGSSTVQTTPVAALVGVVTPGASRLEGLGDLLAVLAPSTAGAPGLEILRQDASDPDELRDLATIPGPAVPPVDPALSVNEQWITVAWGERALVQRVGTGGPYGAPAGIQVPPTALRAVALGDRLAVVTADALLLYDVTAPPSPALLATFALKVPVTSLVAAGEGVFVFTTTGYGYLDPEAATFASSDSAALKGVTAAQAYGGKLYVGGPSEIAGEYRIARLDASAPPALTVEIQNERVAHSDAASLRDFAFDAKTGEYLLLDVPQQAGAGQAGPGATPPPAMSLLRYRESGGALVLAGAAVLPSLAPPGGAQALPPVAPGVLHAFRGRAYVVLAGPQGGVAVYRLPP